MDFNNLVKGKSYIFLGYRHNDGQLQNGEEHHEEFLKPIICVETPLAGLTCGVFKFPCSGRLGHFKEDEVGETPSKPLEDWM